MGLLGRTKRRGMNITRTMQMFIAYASSNTGEGGGYVAVRNMRIVEVLVFPDSPSLSHPVPARENIVVKTNCYLSEGVI